MAIRASSLLNTVTNVFRAQTAKVMKATIAVEESHEKWGGDHQLRCRQMN
jgi:hypothetical protein